MRLREERNVSALVTVTLNINPLVVNLISVAANCVQNEAYETVSTLSNPPKEMFHFVEGLERI